MPPVVEQGQEIAFLIKQVMSMGAQTDPATELQWLVEITVKIILL